MAFRRKRRRFGWLSEIVSVLTLLGIVAVAAAWFEDQNALKLSGAFRVVDGDSLSQGERRLRLLGIDAPEFDQTCNGAAGEFSCGKAARDHLKTLVEVKNIRCVSAKSDQYGRLLATCYSGDTNINAAIVIAGWAISYGDYGAEERAASAKKKGLWAGTFDRPDRYRARYGGLLETEHRAVLTAIWQRLRYWFNSDTSEETQ
ncbi:MAG: thermonuclease family protein [Ahrensia sp.]|nr:thermonuclease family protein [Ahrensia sp.]